MKPPEKVLRFLSQVVSNLKISFRLPTESLHPPITPTSDPHFYIASTATAARALRVRVFAHSLYEDGVANLDHGPDANQVIGNGLVTVRVCDLSNRTKQFQSHNAFPSLTIRTNRGQGKPEDDLY
ncbi:hypothetical protein DPMN_090959 [Dreissena polymorpha]|uniref:Uncharacterized protein n=1 Tax=Dreissena polymorpha TaxID=45954 RepID=A0A9D4R089_DREPO|nr:hypothetical protein DPMN_090959 [Dreissena polymorpha]